MSQDMYIARIPVNNDYTQGTDISNMYIFIANIGNKSAGNMARVGRQIVEELQARTNYWPNNDNILNLPEDSYREFAERFVFKYHNVERIDSTKYGHDTTFQHDRGSFGTDTRKVITLA